MQKNSNRGNQPMLPIVLGDDRDALHFLLMSFYELGMIFKGGDILPALQSRSIDQQSDFAISADDGIDLRRNFRKIVNLQFSGAMIFNALAEITSIFIMHTLLQPLPTHPRILDRMECWRRAI